MRSHAATNFTQYPRPTWSQYEIVIVPSLARGIIKSKYYSYNVKPSLTCNVYECKWTKSPFLKIINSCLVSKSWRNLLIFSIRPATSARRHVCMSPPKLSLSIWMQYNGFRLYSSRVWWVHSTERNISHRNITRVSDRVFFSMSKIV